MREPNFAAIFAERRKLLARDVSEDEARASAGPRAVGSPSTAYP